MSGDLTGLCLYMTSHNFGYLLSPSPPLSRPYALTSHFALPPPLLAWRHLWTVPIPPKLCKAILDWPQKDCLHFRSGATPSKCSSNSSPSSSPSSPTDSNHEKDEQQQQLQHQTDKQTEHPKTATAAKVDAIDSSQELSKSSLMSIGGLSCQQKQQQQQQQQQPRVQSSPRANGNGNGAILFSSVIHTGVRHQSDSGEESRWTTK